MDKANSVPPLRLQTCNDSPVRSDGDFVLYWMIAFRRTSWNFGLQRAVDWAKKLKKPLVIFEPLRAAYRWASDRLHRFAIDGMADNAARLEAMRNRGILYYPYVEPAPDADKGLLRALAARSCVIVTDEYPCFFLPRMVDAAAQKLPVRLEMVDSNGLLPLRATDKVFTTAYSFRRFLHKRLPAHLAEFPARQPLAGLKLPAIGALPAEIVKRWPPAPEKLLAGDAWALGKLPIDHSVPVVDYLGGARAARSLLIDFVENKLEYYDTLAKHPDEDTASGLSPYLHFGHISAHEIFYELSEREGWSPKQLSPKATGRREGWWNMSSPAEAFVDQLVTWRELGFNMSSKSDDYDRYESLPNWAQATLGKHASDPRDYIYTLEEFEQSRTHDELWNAAQRQLVREGRIHNYLRMVWGKKILEWTASPHEALDITIELNNKYAVDGRDPNSYSGIFWVLGRYDRQWGPERPIFGAVRYMSSENTKRKLRVREYLIKYGP